MIVKTRFTLSDPKADQGPSTCTRPPDLPRAPNTNSYNPLQLRPEMTLDFTIGKLVRTGY